MTATAYRFLHGAKHWGSSAPSKNTFKLSTAYKEPRKVPSGSCIPARVASAAAIVRVEDGVNEVSCSAVTAGLRSSDIVPV